MRLPRKLRETASRIVKAVKNGTLRFRLGKEDINALKINGFEPAKYGLWFADLKRIGIHSYLIIEMLKSARENHGNLHICPYTKEVKSRNAAGNEVWVKLPDGAEKVLQKHWQTIRLSHVTSPDGMNIAERRRKEQQEELKS